MARDALPPRLLWYMPAGAGEAWKGVGVCARADTAASPEASPPRHTQGKEAAMCARGTHALTRPRVAVGRPSCQVKRALGFLLSSPTKRESGEASVSGELRVSPVGGELRRFPAAVAATVAATFVADDRLSC